MLTLKLQRVGKKHQPSYRLVVDEKRHRMGGRVVESLGWYNPRSKEGQFNADRIAHWLGHGAQKTDTVHNLLVKKGIISGAKIAVHQTKKETKATA